MSEEQSSAKSDVAARLAELTGQPPRVFEEIVRRLPHPARGLLNLERWLRATSSPILQMETALAAPEALRRFLLLVSTSQAVADVLIQNPELAHLVIVPGPFDVSLHEIVEEGRALLASSSGFAHSLDRIRFLKQRWMLPIVVADVFDLTSPQAVWLALSEVADALLLLTSEIVWQNYAGEKGLGGQHGLTIVGFGKLGGRELNYSSDIDIVYCSEDDPPEDVRKHQVRFAEALGRALSDRSGRGSLYRVDLRLRPYGAQGPLVSSLDAVEIYYRNYAEPWEIQALLRSRPVVGSDKAKKRWARMRETACFRPSLGEPALEAMLAMRERIGDYADEADFKRGHGGIRDVEFLIQILQLANGNAMPDVRIAGTIECAEALGRHGLIEADAVTELIDGYTFLRKLEHRCQLLGDRQTHALPVETEALLSVTTLMGFSDPVELNAELARRRRTIGSLYAGYLRNVALPHVREELGAAATDWLALMPMADEFFAAVETNAGSAERVRRVANLAPALLARLRHSVSLTEGIMSGEIEESFSPSEAIAALPVDVPLERLARTYERALLHVCLQWTLDVLDDLGKLLTELADALLEHVSRRLYLDADLIALGSYARGELTYESDLDVVYLVADPRRQPEAELALQQAIGLLAHLRQHGAPVEIDLRLRPDGGKGLLVRSYEALKTYDLDGMDLWERFALGQGRLVSGSSQALDVVNRSSYGLPLTPERLAALVAMKHRIETERVKPQHSYRNIKLGRGGLGDIEWFVHLFEMRYPTALASGTMARMSDRIKILGRAMLITSIEADELQEGHDHLLRTRHWLALQGIDDSIVPENPDRLGRLAMAMGFDDGNAFLSRHESTVSRVREIYEDGIARLRP